MPTTTLRLHVQSGTDALHRVTSVCRRRDIKILALAYSNNEISLMITGNHRQMRQIDRWLDALVNVFAVENCDPRLRCGD